VTRISQRAKRVWQNFDFFLYSLLLQSARTEKCLLSADLVSPDSTCVSKAELVRHVYIGLALHVNVDFRGTS
jgi:hypothetical protein